MTPIPTRPRTFARLVLRFCTTCNARERIIRNGRCVVCGQHPSEVRA